MLDGRVLEASQVEYKPFGKPPLKREASLLRLFEPHMLLSANKPTSRLEGVHQKQKYLILGNQGDDRRKPEKRFAYF